MGPEELFFFLLVGGSVPLVLWLEHARAHRQFRDDLNTAAQSLGLKRHRSALRGELAGSDVTVRLTYSEEGTGRMEVTVSSRALPRDLMIASQQIPFDADALGSGDPEFDLKFSVAGNSTTACAALSAKNRAALLELLGPSPNAELSLFDGDLRVEVDYHPRLIEAYVPRALALADSLRLELPLGARLLENFRDEPRTGVRKQLTRLMFRRYAKTEEAKQLIELGLEDASPEIQALAAIQEGGDAGHATLLSLLESRRPSRAVRTKALQALVEVYEARDLEAPLLRLLDGPRSSLLSAAVATVGALELQSARPRLIELADTADEATGVKLCTALAALGGSDAEAALLRLFERWEMDLKVSAARALGQIGTANALAALKPHTRGVLKDSELKRAARAAVDEILSRAGELSSGRLSVLGEPEDAERGALSLGTEAGALALPPEEDDDDEEEESP